MDFGKKIVEVPTNSHARIVTSTSRRVKFTTIDPDFGL